MKTELVPITITEEMVREFERIFGRQSKLPPTFPMIFYQYIDIPWRDPTTPILRKQYCTATRELVVGETYHCQVSLEYERQKGTKLFYNQVLTGYDERGEECFRCLSELAANLPSAEK
ncbi:hypothetical protein [Virgibacillus sediminis]|uniref:Uncharacterized protein n=1 Tax=Virgibacillus sediminis TaxID=202260 RepID=A0ABV7A9D5_9BACI